MKRMFGIALVLLLIGNLAVTLPAKEIPTEEVFASDSTLIPQRKHAREAQVVYTLLTTYHYRKTPVNDSLSEAIFHDYLGSLDPAKVYLLEGDYDRFSNYRYKLDDGIPDGDMEFAFEVFNIYRERVQDRIKWVLNRLEGEPFDFSLDETYQTNRESVTYAANSRDLDDTWRKILKSQALSYLLGDEDKSWDEISEALKKRYRRQLRTNEQFKSEDVFQAYMNALATAFDPHTNYFSPVSSENFQINMSQTLEGIGARLTTDMDYTKVAEVIPGGPVSKSKALFANDRIIAVAQGLEEEFVDVIGWRIDDVVQLIRGPKGTVVRLKVLKAADGPTAQPVVVTLVRDKVNLEDEVATSEVVPVTMDGQNYRVGIITIPSFYMEFDAASRGEKDYNSTTRDVRRLITEMQNDGGIDALMIDLRYNGGGSLQEAIELSGLFIPDGPVVQVKNYTGKVEVQNDPDETLFYDGPLSVMVNRFSASASEIFSGAIQDYGRGVIMGDITYGKGTVQHMIGLNNMVRTEDRLGNVKLTLAKFYRVTGSSTQTIGVTPDVMLPSEFEANQYGEASQDNELPWDQIASAEFNPMNYVSDEALAQLNDFHQGRLATDPDLKALLNQYQEAREARKKTEISLNEATRKKEIEERQKRLAQDDALMDDSIDPTGEGIEVAEEEKMDDTLLWEGVLLLSKLINMHKFG